MAATGCIEKTTIKVVSDAHRVMPMGCSLVMTNHALTGSLGCFHWDEGLAVWQFYQASQRVS